MKSSKGEKLFNVFNIIFLTVVCITTLYPFINTLAYSFNEGADATRGGIYFLPRVFSLKSYKLIFSDSIIINAFTVTISRTVLGIILTTFGTGIFAYALSKKDLVGRNFYLVMCVFAMIFNAGLVPTYMLYRSLHLIDHFQVYILPGVINLWYMILMKTFFEQFPVELEESAQIDGATRMQIFFRIVIPLSMPIIATICIFTGVDQWNAWFDGYMFVNNDKIQPIQTYLYKVIAMSQGAQDASTAQLLSQDSANLKTVQSATVMVAVLPIVFIYSLFQKHFAKGVMIGAIKG